MALVWLAWRAQQIVDQLTPVMAHSVRTWLGDGHEHARALTRLNHGEAYALVIADYPVCYVLTVTPESDDEGEPCHAS
ncbi:hypothetical protein [Streptomyces gobiensis]|uniref:hypothetical protein n=1 Tax=Streptomyces gobiensis TaxID=2875706 RepID=UPI001E4A6FAF|nr:hypothetical protein [Streptomyces gobiensis]UGY94495.1 hypothetical protein test1122_24025 [Streptomyces gobiensis]